jgi:hypothetical protein
MTESAGVEGASRPDTGSDDEAVALVRSYARAFGEEDVASCTAFFAEDATIDFLRRFTGHEAIERWHRKRFENRVRIVEIVTVQSAGDTVTVDAVVTSKLLKLGFTLRGSAVFRLGEGKIKELGFGFTNVTR